MYGFFEIGLKIQYYRTKRGFSKSDFARKIKIAESRLDEIETGTVIYQFKTLEKIASALEIDLHKLLDFN